PRHGFPPEIQEEDASDLTFLQKLRQSDLAVRTHEGLHQHAAGGLASGDIHYEYQEGPDGTLYAVGGHVDIQTSATSDPEKATSEAATAALAAAAPGDAS